MMKMHWEGTPSWLGYITVEDVDTTTAKATEMGCGVCVEPTDIPSFGRFAVFTDPVGATIGVFTHLSECCNDSSCCS
jgi:predicted enzyme related to lactoylglutathione lyase